MTTIWELGKWRGERTGRTIPTESDWDWLGEQMARHGFDLDLFTHPETGVEFEAGMSDGAWDASDDFSEDA